MGLSFPTPHLAATSSLGTGEVSLFSKKGLGTLCAARAEAALAVFQILAHHESDRGALADRAGLKGGTGLYESHLVDVYGILEGGRVWIESDEYEDRCRVQFRYIAGLQVFNDDPCETSIALEFADRVLEPNFDLRFFGGRLLPEAAGKKVVFELEHRDFF